MSKISDVARKSLNLRAYQQTTATAGPRGAEPASVASGAASGGLRLPTGDPGLPCDWLFAAAGEAVLIVDAATQCVLRANPAAVALLRTSEAALSGVPVMQAFESSSIPEIQRSIDVACAGAGSDRASVRSAGDHTELSAKVSVFHAGAESYLLFRLASTNSPAAAESPVIDAIEGADTGFLVTDAGLRVEYANQAFIDLAELTPLTQILGKSLVLWLEFSESDLAQLQHQMRKRQATTTMTARLRTERNRSREVEVCAVAVPDGQLTCWGFTVRGLPSLN